MIGYTTVGTADMERAKKFYCDLFESKGAKVLVDAGRIAMIGAYVRDHDGNKLCFFKFA